MAEAAAPPRAKRPLTPEEERRFLVCLATVAAALLTVGLVLWVLSRTVPFAVDWALIRRTLIPQPEHQLRPEPKERFLFLAGLALLPAALAAFFLLFSGSAWPAATAEDPRWRAARTALHMLPALALAGALLGLVLPRVPGTRWAAAHALPAALALPVALPLLGRSLLRPGPSVPDGLPVLRLLPDAGAALLVLAVFLYCLFGLPQVVYQDVYYMNFEAFFNPVVQVAHGREILVDIQSQYGLYPHFLEPLFALTGLSVLKFTATMGALLCLSLAVLYRFLAAEAGDRRLAFLGFAALLSLCYVIPRLGKPDHYFQYYPLRFVVPALSLPLAARYLRGPSVSSSAPLLLLGSLGTLWNPETGLVVLLSTLILMAADGFGTRDARGLARRLGAGLAVAAGAAGAFALLLAVRFGRAPDYAALLLPARRFYGMGLFMWPMEVPGPWMIVAAAYCVGLCLGLGALLRREWGPRAGLMLYLSVLGWGLFSYYQGRSVPPVLLAVCYPAVVIATLLAGDLRRLVREARAPGEQALFALLLAGLLLPAAALATAAPEWAAAQREKIRLARLPPGPVARNADFVRSHTRPGERVMIISGQAGVFHLVSGTSTPVAVPSVTTVATIADLNSVLAYAKSGRTYVIDLTVPELASAFALMMRHARSVEWNADRTVAVVNGLP